MRVPTAANQPYDHQPYNHRNTEKCILSVIFQPVLPTLIPEAIHCAMRDKTIASEYTRWGIPDQYRPIVPSDAECSSSGVLTR
jgi:hypothetical protein